jgi:hypothetical protein
VSPADAQDVRHEIGLVLGLLEHAGTHHERGNAGAVGEAVADAVRRLQALRERLAEEGSSW